MSSVRIVPAVSGDIVAIMRIERVAFSDPWSESAFESLSTDGRVFFVCARQLVQGTTQPPTEDRVAGYVVAVFAADEGEIVNLAVAPDERGHGVGGALLDAVLHKAEVRRAVALFLEVRESNAPALRLYNDRGFAAVGRRRGYYHRPAEDALILRRSIGGASAVGSAAAPQ